MATGNCYIGLFTFDGWFYSKSSSESEMNVGGDIICMVKTYTKGFCEDTLKSLT